MNKRGTIAISQILILVIGIIALTWMIGSVGGKYCQKLKGGKLKNFIN